MKLTLIIFQDLIVRDLVNHSDWVRIIEELNDETQLEHSTKVKM